MMRMKPQDHQSQQAEPAEYSKNCRNSRYTLWKARRAGLCHISPRELDDENMYWFSGSTTLAN